MLPHMLFSKTVFCLLITYSYISNEQIIIELGSLFVLFEKNTRSWSLNLSSIGLLYLTAMSWFKLVHILKFWNEIFHVKILLCFNSIDWLLTWKKTKILSFFEIRNMYSLKIWSYNNNLLL